MPQSATDARPVRRGMAVMMVIVLTGLCAVLGYAMLWGAATNAQVADNAILAARADALAESGANMAAYYLRYPTNGDVPAGFLTAGDTYGASSVSLGTGLDGYVNLTVTRDVPLGWDFTIAVTGVAQDGPLRAARTLSSTVHCETQFDVKHALSVQSDAVIEGPVNVTGRLQTKGVMTLMSTGTINGAVDVPYHRAAPTWAEIKNYGMTAPGPTYTYTHQGVTYTAATVTSPITNLASLPAVDVATNPLRIYYCPTDLEIFPIAGLGNVSMTGSLVVNGRLLLGASAITTTRTLTITPVAGTATTPGGPALVVKNDVSYLARNKRLDLRGLVWVGDGVTGDLANNSGSTFTVTGAYLTPNWPGVRSYGGTMTITYDAAKVAVWDFETTKVSNQVPTLIQVRTFAPAGE